MESIKTFTLRQIIPAIGKYKKNIVIDGYRLRLNTEKMFLYRDLGNVCCICGIRGCFFKIDKSCEAEIKRKFNGKELKREKIPHILAMYALDNNKNHIRMTIDHILPKIRYPDLRYVKDNLCLMCAKCNGSKSGLPIIEFMKSDYVLKMKKTNFVFL